MNSRLIWLSLFAVCSTASATTRYVDLNCPTPTAPYTNWTTAANTIQDAIDAAGWSDLVLVTNGAYASGGRVLGGMTNRVIISKSVTLQSVNGAASTIIQGYQVPGATNGSNAIRCVYLSSGTLSGFTLTNGATAATGAESATSGGGLYCQSGEITNCVITGNCAALYGGGAYKGDLRNCTISGNSARQGGGAYNSTLDTCVITRNSATTFGGGASGGLLVFCAVSGNWASQGGGVFFDPQGGGSVNYCTITGNSARIGGGVVAARDSILSDCIIFFNDACWPGQNYLGGSLSYCCTTPLPSSGAGNFELDPQLASLSHLSAGSPCRGAGYYPFGQDFDGEVWANPPSIGCDEYNVGSVTGALNVAIGAAYTNVAAGFGVDFTALIDGRTSASVWDFGDSTTVSNRPYARHAWTTAGTYEVGLTAFNESHPEGVRASVSIQVQPLPVHYVSLGSTNPSPPYTSWGTAAADIQSAVDATSLPGALVLVDDGIFDSGGRAVYGTMTNRLAVEKPVTVQSVNGPAKTMIVGAQAPTGGNGDGAIRCVYLADGAILSGFTLTNGATRVGGEAEHENKGGAVWCPSSSGVITNCLLTSNSGAERAGAVYGGILFNCTLTNNSASDGGAVYGSSLTDCVLAGNRASLSGGAANSGSLFNCTLLGNSANGGGATYSSFLSNCTVTANSASEGGGAYWGVLNNCVLTNNSATNGGGASRAALEHCLLTHNSASSAGGGSYLGTLNQCTLLGNTAMQGGGASSGTLINCLLTGNSAESGGGEYNSFLTNSTLAGNSAPVGAGASGGSLYNSIVYFNYADSAAGVVSNYDVCTMNYCCTVPLPASGLGNFTNDPLFLDWNGGDLHLQSNSPCINAGWNHYVSTTTDLDGNPRIVGGTVDVGAYEFQTPLSRVSYAWLQSYGLATDGSADFNDADGDGLSNLQEWLAGTDPTNSTSRLQLFISAVDASGITVTWQSTTNRTYFLERATDLAARGCFSCVASNLVGGFETTSFTDTNLSASGPVLYRVGVQAP